MIQEHFNCRLCKSDNIETILNFGETALANSYLKESQLNDPEFKAPLEVFLCHNCGSVQLKHTVLPEALFSNYLYASSQGPLAQYFEKYAKEVANFVELEEKDLVVDIGSNDGVLLKPFKRMGFKVLGIEPARNLAAQSNELGLETVCEFFNAETGKQLAEKYGRARLITCNNAFAHISDLDSIVKGVKNLLLEEGCFVFENAYLLDTVQGKYIDQIYHEHLYYHSLKPLITFFEKHGMYLFHVQRTPIQGGSIRCYVSKRPVLATEAVKTLLEQEDIARLYDRRTYSLLKLQVSEISDLLNLFIFNEKNYGRRVCAYGAPAKFTTLCKVMGIKNGDFDYVVDDSPIKQGLFTPDNHIKIVSRQYFLDNPPDSCVITAWNFTDNIIKNNLEYKGKFVKILPELEVV